MNYTVRFSTDLFIKNMISGYVYGFWEVAPSSSDSEFVILTSELLQLLSGNWRSLRAWTPAVRQSPAARHCTSPGYPPLTPPTPQPLGVHGSKGERASLDLKVSHVSEFGGCKRLEHHPKPPIKTILLRRKTDHCMCLDHFHWTIYKYHWCDEVTRLWRHLCPNVAKGTDFMMQEALPFWSVMSVIAQSDLILWPLTWTRMTVSTSNIALEFSNKHPQGFVNRVFSCKAVHKFISHTFYKDSW